MGRRQLSPASGVGATVALTLAIGLAAAGTSAVGQADTTEPESRVAAESAPTVAVSVDGNVVSTTRVTAMRWTDYSVPAAATAAQPGTSTAYFPQADWLWKPIGANPALAANSATWARHFSAPGTQHVAELFGEGTTLIPAASITSATPRYDVTFTQAWGPDPFMTYSIPIPAGTVVPHYTGGDGHLAIQDPDTGQVFGLWQAAYDSKSGTWTASWGGMTPINGNGIDVSGSATATNLSRYAGVVTAAEMTAAISADTGLAHALVFATDIAGPGFVAPATKSDGTNDAGIAVPIPQGYRVQLDPAVDVAAIPGITPGEKVIAKTLQTHGAYVVDKGSARMAFAFEAVPGASSSNPGKAWTDAGFGWDYYDMARIPWSQLRVLAA